MHCIRRYTAGVQRPLCGSPQASPWGSSVIDPSALKCRDAPEQGREPGFLLDQAPSHHIIIELLQATRDGTGLLVADHHAVHAHHRLDERGAQFVARPVS